MRIYLITVMLALIAGCIMTIIPPMDEPEASVKCGNDGTYKPKFPIKATRPLT